MKTTRTLFTATLFLISLFTFSTYAQNERGFEFDFGVQSYDLPKASGYISGKYIVPFNAWANLFTLVSTRLTTFSSASSTN